MRDVDRDEPDGKAREISELKALLAEARETIDALVSGHVDTVTATAGSTPLLVAKAQLALSESERWYREIVETTNEGILVLDLDFTVTFANRRMAEMLRCAPDALVGGSLFDYMDEQSKEIAQREMNLRSVGESMRREFRFMRTDGSPLWVLASAVPLRDSAGTVYGSLSMIMNITEQKEMRAKLVLADRMTTVGVLAAGVAHEINNPLAVVRANLDLIAEDVPALAEHGPLPRDLLDALADSRSAVERIRLIVRDLKVFSRSEEEQLEPVDLRQVIETAIRMSWNEIRHRARLVKDYGNTPPVIANEPRLGQVFINLLVNAAQAIPVGAAEKNEIRITTRTTASGHVVAEVRDTGSGMSADTLSKLFEPFFTTKPVGVGSGLGLSICQGIIGQLGGEIAVESELGKGTVFRVTLRTAVMSVRPEVEDVRASPKPQRRGRVLIVEDDAVVARSLERRLSRDHDVTVATMARDALRLLTTGKTFDVVFSDLMMPEMTGMDLYEELKRIGLSHVAEQMVFLTGGAFTSSAGQFMAAVRNASFEKPFDIQSIKALIQERLR